MENKQYEELRNTFHDGLEAAIENIDDNTKKEAKTLQESIDQLKKANEELKETIKIGFDGLKDEWGRLVEILNKLL